MKAVVYARVTGWDQTQELKAQVTAGTAMAHALGSQDVQVLQDTFGGASLERPAMSRLRDMVRSREVDLVVVSGPNELSPVSTREGVRGTPRAVGVLRRLNVADPHEDDAFSRAPSLRAH